MLSDLRLALRQLRKSPGFTLVAVLTLTLGIGANTAIFSVINATLLRPLPYPEPRRLVEFWSQGTEGPPRQYVTGPQLKHWQEHATMFEGIAGIWDRYTTNLIDGNRGERIHGACVSANYLEVLGVRPVLGRGFAPGEDIPENEWSLAVLTYETWQSRFGGDTGVLDRVIDLGGWRCRVIGVLPPRALPNEKLEVLMPLPLGAFGDWQMRPDNPWICVTARIKPGITTAAADAEIRTLSDELYGRILPSYREKMRTTVRPMQAQLIAETRPALFILVGAVGLVLLIVCANLANLLLARAGMRQKEMAVRATLGASMGRLVRLALTESIVLALAGGALGIAVAAATLRIFSSVTASMLPHLMQPTLDVRVLAFSLVLAGVTGIAFGLIPAWRVARTDLTRDLKESGRGTTPGSRAHAQSLFIVSEIALTVMLLITAGLLLRSFVRIMSADYGFERAHTLVCALSPTMSSFYRQEDATGDARKKAFDRMVRFHLDVVTRLEARPDVVAAGTVTTLPLGGEYWGAQVGLPGQPAEEDRPVPLDYIGHHYFRAMGMTLLQGRELTEAENVHEGPRVVVINQTLARVFFPGENPLGRHLRMNNAEWQVVGVVSDVRHEKLDSAPTAHIYAVQATSPVTAGFVVRGRTDPHHLENEIRSIVAAIDPAQSVGNFRTLADAVSQSLRERRITLSLVGVFAGAALALACLGIYGVIAYTIGQRRREFSIRFALGAQNRDVVSLVLRDGLKLGLAGVGLGLLGALAGARLVASRLYEVGVVDPYVFGTVTVLLATAILASILIPALRATRANPIEALRAD